MNSATSPTIRVAIVEDDREIRQLFVLLLNATEGFVCTGDFESAEAALVHLKTETTDVILMDIDLPGMSGIACTQQLRQSHPALNIVMLTVHEDEKALFDSLCAGATGYILKELAPSSILDHIRTAAAGGSPMSGSIARKVIATFQTKPAPISPLSQRETEVLGLLVEGKNYKTIAEKLFVSANTVKAHIKNIYHKLEVHTRAEAVSKAHRDRLI